MKNNNLGYPRSLTEPMPGEAPGNDTRPFARAEVQAQNAISKLMQESREMAASLTPKDKHVNANGPDAAFLTKKDGLLGIEAFPVKHYTTPTASTFSEEDASRDILNAHQVAASKRNCDLLFNVDNPVHSRETFSTSSPYDSDSASDVGMYEAQLFAGMAEAAARRYPVGDNAPRDVAVAVTTNSPLKEPSVTALASRPTPMPSIHITDGRLTAPGCQEDSRGGHQKAAQTAAQEHSSGTHSESAPNWSCRLSTSGGHGSSEIVHDKSAVSHNTAVENAATLPTIDNGQPLTCKTPYQSGQLGGGAVGTTDLTTGRESGPVTAPGEAPLTGGVLKTCTDNATTPPESCPSAAVPASGLANSNVLKSSMGSGGPLC